MKRLLEKLPLGLLCIVAFAFTGLDAEPIFLLLLTAAVSLTAQYMGDRTATAYLLAAVGIVSVFYPVAICGLPLILYDELWMGKPWLVATYITTLIRINEIRTEQLIITAAAAGTALIMYLRIGALEKSIQSLLSLRNQTEQSNMALIEKNYRLTEAQDNEVRLATLKERNRIAREIHDNVGHMLTRSLLQSGALIVINKDEKLKAPLEDLKSTLDTAMTSIRQSVHDLHDDSIDFDAVAYESIRSVENKFKVKYRNEAGSDLPVKIRLCFLAVIKEGLSNAVKHSKGDRMMILVREHPAFYQLNIEDNGECSENMRLDKGGIGLQNMRDRVESLGGMINFIPSAEGFRIIINIPKNTKSEN